MHPKWREEKLHNHLLRLRDEDDNDDSQASTMDGWKFHPRLGCRSQVGGYHKEHVHTQALAR